MMKMAAGAELEEVDFEGNYTPGEIEEFVRGMKLLFQVRDTILRVNLGIHRERGAGRCLSDGAARSSCRGLIEI